VSLARPLLSSISVSLLAIAALGLALALPCHAESHPSPSPTLTLDAARGAKLYGRMCAVCHGPNGEGYAADQAPRLAQPDFLASVSDEYLRGAIADGRRGSTMSAWAQNRGGPLTRSDIDAIVVYIRGWQQGPSVRLDEQPLRADPFKGTVIFAAQCTTCHGARGVGGPQMQVGGADLLGSATDGFLRHAIRHGRPGTPMPAFEKTLSPQQIEDVVAALRSFQTRPDGHPLSRPPPLPLGPVPLNPAVRSRTGSRRSRARRPPTSSTPSSSAGRASRSSTRGRPLTFSASTSPVRSACRSTIPRRTSISSPRTPGSSATARVRTPSRAISRASSSRTASPR
jgi:mono/diheme cytochrome c family protein